jgi:NitT/TauT family transport system substrate-binding protein
MKRARLPVLVFAAVLLAAATPASAHQPLRIGMGNGLAFLPVYVATDLKLFEKHARAEGMSVKPIFHRVRSSAAMQEALLTGRVDVAPFGVSAFLLTREKTKGSPQEAVAISGLTTLPMVLVSNRADVRSLSDFKPKDRIALPVLSGPQMYLLQMQSEKTFGAGQADKLRNQVAVLPHAQAIEALDENRDNIAGYFASPPFSQSVTKNQKFAKVLSSPDIIGGKASFLVMTATKRGTAAQPKLAQVMVKALGEAADMIRKEPRKAAQIFLKFEPSRSLDIKTLEAVLRDLKDEFGSEVHGVETYAGFMGRHGALKQPPKSWKDVVSPQLAAMPGS